MELLTLTEALGEPVEGYEEREGLREGGGGDSVELGTIEGLKSLSEGSAAKQEMVRAFYRVTGLQRQFWKLLKSVIHF